MATAFSCHRKMRDAQKALCQVRQALTFFYKKKNKRLDRPHALVVLCLSKRGRLQLEGDAEETDSGVVLVERVKRLEKSSPGGRRRAETRAREDHRSCVERGARTDCSSVAVEARTSRGPGDASDERR